MRKEERYKGVLNWFNENVPVAETELHYDNPYQLLIAVILSAQCTDKRVNMITPALFRDFPTPEVMAASTPEVIFEYIRSVSYPSNKSKHLVGMAKMLMSDFGGVVPSDSDELQKLPGVGRKTANVIASVVYNKPAMAVDTHVFRVANFYYCFSDLWFFTGRNIQTHHVFVNNFRRHTPVWGRRCNTPFILG